MDVSLSTYLQHTSEWPDCGGGWYQPGGCHSAVCCYSAEEHQGHSGVSLKSLLHFTEPLKASVKRFSFRAQCLLFLLVRKIHKQVTDLSNKDKHSERYCEKDWCFFMHLKRLHWNLTYCILNQISRFLIGREKPGTQSEVARLISETLEQEKKQQQRQQHLDDHYEHSTEEVSHLNAVFKSGNEMYKFKRQSLKFPILKSVLVCEPLI